VQDRATASFRFSLFLVQTHTPSSLQTINNIIQLALCSEQMSMRMLLGLWLKKSEDSQNQAQNDQTSQT
jgi:hypothetical protein